MKRLLLLLTALCCLAVSAPAAAASTDYNPLQDACKTQGSDPTATACSATTGNPLIGPHGLIQKVSMLLAVFAGITAIIMIVVSGLNYVTAGGDPKKAESARNVIIDSVIGLVVIAGAETIVYFVVSKI